LRTSERRTKNDKQQKKTSFDHISTSLLRTPQEHRTAFPSGKKQDDGSAMAVAGYGKPVAAILFL